VIEKRKMGELYPRVNFINVLTAAFTCADPKSIKKTNNLTVFFMHLRSAGAKAAHRTLMKLTPRVFNSKL